MVQAILSLLKKFAPLQLYFSLLRKRFLWPIPYTKYFLKLMSSLKVIQSKAETKIWQCMMPGWRVRRTSISNWKVQHKNDCFCNWQAICRFR